MNLSRKKIVFYRRTMRMSAICLLLAAVHAAASGLQTSFSNIYQENVPLGAATIIKATNGKGLVIKNIGDSTMRVRAEILKPSVDQLREGAEAIPQAGWVTLTPASVDVPAHRETEISVIVQVPKEHAYRARHYQFMIWSRAEPLAQEGMSVTPGLLSRIRIRTAAQ
jgi:hypothetical protein